MPMEQTRLEMTIEFQDKKWLLRQLTDIFYQFGLNIESLHTEQLENDIVRDHFILSSEEEDYYLYERVIDRIQFEIPEFLTSKLISFQ
jgi:(p)ppGpp synthase/HD superfamily hydrolase